jgi:hypothetical protein
LHADFSFEIKVWYSGSAVGVKSGIVLGRTIKLKPSRRYAGAWRHAAGIANPINVDMFADLAVG